jgi:hypothetical protein
LPRTADTNATVRLERQEVLVTCDDDVGLRRQRRGQDEVIIRIAADASDAAGRGLALGFGVKR